MHATARSIIASLILATCLSVHGLGAPQALAEVAKPSEVVEITWEELVPADWNPNAVFEKYDIGSLLDNSPEAAKIMEEIKASMSHAPVVKELNGKTVKLPGYVVPLQHDGEKVSEFLLVPYFGACIHVPPPPSNQTVYVVAEGNSAARRELFDTVWVTGELSAKWTGSQMGDAGYTIKASEVIPYEY